MVREIHDHLDIIKDSSLLVHVAGTRSFVSDDPVTAMSYLFIELAISLDKPIVPVYFSGGLPVVNETKGRFDLPYQCTKQDVTIGNPILPNDFLSLSHSERKKLVLDSLNNLAPNDPSPNQPNPELVCAIQSIKSEFKVDELKAVLIYSILNAKDPHEDTLLLCEMLKNPDCFDRQTYGDFFKMVDYLRRSAE
ncbi:MAG: hypothetical protein NTX76_06320 [Alphaproteobacteria bacterium]|nr:hypothetical protein [Alphaproteobacteria bacterium]